MASGSPQHLLKRPCSPPPCPADPRGSGFRRRQGRVHLLPHPEPHPLLRLQAPSRSSCSCPLARNPASPAAALRPPQQQPPVETPPPPPYGFHNLDRRTMILADGTVRSYFALPPDYPFEPTPLPSLPHLPRAGPDVWPPQQPPLAPHDAKRKHPADPDEGFPGHPKQPRFESPHHPSQVPPHAAVDRHALRRAFLKYAKMLNDSAAQRQRYLECGRVPCLACGSVFVASTLMEYGGVPQSATPESLLKEAIHVISCGYEDKSDWGTEIGWIYGSVTEDILTGFKMHARGWRSFYCMPKRPAFKGSAPINLSDRLNQVLRWALGSVEILFSRHCPIWYGYGGRLKFLERFAYINTTIYPLTSLPLLLYCILPAICLLTGKFIIPEVAERALFLWNNDHIEGLIKQNNKLILPIILPALERNTKGHWNQAVQSLSLNVREIQHETAVRSKREATWKRLEEIAMSKSTSSEAALHPEAIVHHQSSPT